MSGQSPTFRAEHVGSFLRPDRLMAAVREHRSGEITPGQLRAVQNECIRELVAFEEALGLSSVTDGEFRRRGWSAGFIDSVEGFGLREGTLGFRDETGDKGTASSPYARAKLRRNRGIATEEFRFLKNTVKNGMP